MGGGKRGVGGKGVSCLLGLVRCTQLHSGTVGCAGSAIWARVATHSEFVLSTQLSELGPAADPRAVGPLKCTASLASSAPALSGC